MSAPQKQEPPILVAEVESPIINSPFIEPQSHWHIERGKPPLRAEGRRRASYFYRVPEHAGRGRPSRAQTEMFESERGEEVELEIVNLIRERVKEWREGERSGGIAYDGASPVTKELFDLWRSDERMQRLFFAQIEAAETIIFLVEATDIYRKGIPEIPKDEPGLASKVAGGAPSSATLARWRLVPAKQLSLECLLHGQYSTVLPRLAMIAFPIPS